MQTLSSATNCLSYTPFSNPVPSTSGLQSGKAITRPFAKKSLAMGVPVKVILAAINRTPKGVSFQEHNQTYIKLTEETANIPYIQEKIKEKTGQDVILMSQNGLPIDDEEGTQGN